MTDSKIHITNGMGSNHVVNNLPASTVIKSYQEPPTKVVVPQSTKEKTPDTINFSKEPVSLSAELQPEAQQAPAEQDIDKPSISAERRDAMKRANQEHQKAIQMQKEAKEMLAQAKQFDELKKNAATNPVALAKALGMDPTEFLRRFQNEMFAIPNEEQKKPEPTESERLTRLEQERQLERQAQADYAATRANYIQTKILPVIKADVEKFQLLSHNNADISAGFIYDMMNAHFKETGEELNPADVAEEMEIQLLKEMEDNIAKVRSVPKLSQYFREQAAAEAETQAVSTTSNELGAKKWSGAKSPVPVISASAGSRKDRLARAKALLK